VRIAVVSDTHLAEPKPWLERVYASHLAAADVLLHCGDMTGYRTWAWLAERHPRFHAVAGNSDDWSLQQELPAMLTLDLDGLRVGLAHGWGDRRDLARTVAQAFGPGYGLFLFGHSHRQEWTVVDGVPALNPGSLHPAGGNIQSLAVIDYRPGLPLTAESVDWIELDG
jgi:putative phosphoesterase